MATQNKGLKITYWIFTGLMGFNLLSGIFFMNSEFAKKNPLLLGVPEWLRLEVGIGNIIGGLLLVLPFVGSRLKEWAYVAVGIVFISAFIGHLAVEGLVMNTFQPIIFFAVLLGSYIPYHKLQAAKVRQQ